MERAIQNSSCRGDTVLEAFGGSGTTAIACEKTGRRGRLVELEPKYVDVIVQRWQQYTGKQAMLSPEGKTFKEIAKREAWERGASVNHAQSRTGPRWRGPCD